jgi:3-oxoadipate enol-lactonase
MRVTIDDAAIDVAIDGKGDAIILLHGFPLTRDEWDAQAAQLAQHALVIRPDLRGMGRSSIPQGPYLMETLAGDVAGLLDALAIDRATIVGHSLGGYAAMALARMHTERVHRLVLVCSGLAADTPEIARSREDLADRLERDQSIEPAIEAYIPKLFAPSNAERSSELLMRAREIARRNDPIGAAAMLRGMAQRAESYDIAEDLGMPVLIIGGAGDQVVPVREYEAMRGAFPRARLEMLPASGHMPMLEEPERLTDLLTAFAGERD